MRYLGAVFLLFVLIPCVYAQAPEDYLEKLRLARESLAGAIEDASLIRESAKKLAELENTSVSTSEGEIIIVRNGWAGILAREMRIDSSGAAARRALAKINAVERQVKKYESDSAEPIKVELASGEEFGDGASKPELGDVNLGIRERLRRLAEWLKVQEEEIQEQENEPVSRRRTEPDTAAVSPGIFTLVVLIIVAVIIAVIAFQIAKNRSASQPGAPRISGLRGRTTLEDALRRTPQEWKELARGFFDGGDYAQALRALYLSLLVVLHRRRLISYDTTKTNWEYVWELGIKRDEHKPFETLTSAFDYKWYGRRECLREEYLKLEEMADAIAVRDSGQE